VVVCQALQDFADCDTLRRFNWCWYAPHFAAACRRATGLAVSRCAMHPPLFRSFPQGALPLAATIPVALRCRQLSVSSAASGRLHAALLKVGTGFYWPLNRPIDEIKKMDRSEGSASRQILFQHTEGCAAGRLQNPRGAVRGTPAKNRR
jgi:hypothetical protein